MLSVIAVAAKACTCGNTLPCANVARSAVVFSGIALRGSSDRDSADARFLVRRAFKGVKAGTVLEIDTNARTSCAAVFETGREYLVFAHRRQNRLSTSQCSGSSLLANAVEELRYLESWQQRKSPTEVVGAIYPDARGSEADWHRYYRAMQSAAIHVAGPTGVLAETRVNDRGEFAARVPKAGSYRVSARLLNWISTPSEINADVPPGSCAQAFFALRPDGRITGSAIESDGSPAKGVLLKVVSIGNVPEAIATRTDGGGRFEFRGVLKGSYRLGVNPEALDDPSPQVPYAPTLYPGVRAEKQAEVIQLPEFGRVHLSRPLRLPPRGKPRTIRVTVTLEDGKPLQHGSISCTAEGHPYWQKELTDAHGMIDFAALDTVDYIVDVDIPSGHPLARAGYERARWVWVGHGTGITAVRVVFRRVAPR